jgi:hypothetical protein
MRVGRPMPSTEQRVMRKGSHIFTHAASMSGAAVRPVEHRAGGSLCKRLEAIWH